MSDAAPVAGGVQRDTASSSVVAGRCPRAHPVIIRGVALGGWEVGRRGTFLPDCYCYIASKVYFVTLENAYNRTGLPAKRRQIPRHPVASHAPSHLRHSIHVWCQCGKQGLA